MSDLAETPPHAPSNGDLSGRQLGDYRLLRRLGRGGMADVYLAEQLSLRRQVAFKVLKSTLAHDEIYVKRFHLEAQAAASLVHANIVQIHEVGCLDGVHFIAQEYVAGMNLKEWITRRGSPDLKFSMLILRQVAAALNRAAEQGIVHRDIKPENVMISQSGEVKVADFGLARVMGDGANMNVTQAGVTMGTPLYMSPEQVEGKSLDPRSDIYSLGVTCYHMLAGEPPFKGDTALGIAVQHLNVQPARLEKCRPDLPPGLCRIVHKMLAKTPADRYSSARELLKELRSLQSEVGGDVWPDEISDWNTAELSALHGRSEATEKLGQAMKTQALILRSRPKWKPILLTGGLLAFLIGGALAYSRREPFLLSQSHKAQSTIEKKESPEAQFLLASFLNTEAAYQAVLTYYPNDKRFVQKAKQQLALLFLEEDDFTRALTLFDEFAHMETVETQSRAFGIAGKAVVLSLQGKHDQAARALIDLVPLRDKLDVKMSRLVASVYRKNQGALNQKSSAEWEQWLQKTLAEPRPPA